ncbi:MAG: hypothetical protein K5853_06130 [Lachnospiraceae bacterium]|nr:hypothetical protein [Lachnospiraceae bacterium]
MQFNLIIPDRQIAVRRLEQMTGTIALYSGPPTFNYQVKDFVVHRDGYINVEAFSKENKQILKSLAQEMIIFSQADFLPAVIQLVQTCPSIALQNYDHRFLLNLIHTLYARGALLNHICHHQKAISITKRLVKNLHNHKSCCPEEFFDTVRLCGGQKCCKGLLFLPSVILFTGMHQCENPEAINLLVSQIGITCSTRQRIHSYVKNNDTKESLRYWLNSLGINRSTYPKEFEKITSAYDFYHNREVKKNA